MPQSVFTDAHKALVEVLVAARKKAGISQVELARRIGRPQNFVSLVERGGRRIDVVEFVVLARAVGADPVKALQHLAALVPDSARI